MKAQPLFVVIEDGNEYTDRFTRFLGSRYRFLRADSLATAKTAAQAHEHLAGLLLDLDFRRTPTQALVDEAGRSSESLTPAERQRLCPVQGILILRALRAAGVRVPALLFADLDDPGQLAFLQASLAPLEILGAQIGMPEIAARLERMCLDPGSPPMRAWRP